ncbi:MAG: bifunctional adenosylcobinamide kinase/adenosylcobinamide-phosphate guanylyltransferase [bacterium]|nr:bifunctional adenosylcobinamide kinase/adenosylcobinamide-phosphate guanylyltransferase [bacterium]
MAEITFIIGGACSGKSSYALRLANACLATRRECKSQVTYIATGVPCDEEMESKIEAHKRTRPKDWKAIEEPFNIEDVIKKLDVSTGVIILDCLTFWVSNLLLQKAENVTQFENNIVNRVSKFASILKDIKSKVIVVSNEVGMGVVPRTRLGRIFRDYLGKANQIVASDANEAFLLTAGIPIKVK